MVKSLHYINFILEHLRISNFGLEDCFHRPGDMRVFELYQKTTTKSPLAKLVFDIEVVILLN